MKKLYIIMVGFLVVVGVHAENPITEAASAVSENAKLIDQLYSELSLAPAWNYSEFEAGRDLVLLKSLGKLGHATNGQVREVVRRLMLSEDEKPFRNSWFKVYIINRLVFDIPADTSWRDVPRVRGGIGFPHDVDSAIWPLIVQEDGSFRIASRSAGYAGPPYQGLEEFDAFARAFARRDLSKHGLDP